MAIGPFTVGPKPPEVTWPTSRPSGVVMTVPSRAGARPSGLMPTRTRAAPSLISRWTRAAPGKPPSSRRRFWIDQKRVPELCRIGSVAGDLETVLACVAGAGDMAPGAIDLHIGRHHERKI